MDSDGMGDQAGGGVSEVSEPEGGAPGAVTELGRVRELVLQAHPDVVPDLVRGDSLDALLASVEPARSAYQQIVERVRGSGKPGAGTPPPAVPAGGTRAAVDTATLTPVTKIARALAARSAAGGAARSARGVSG